MPNSKKIDFLLRFLVRIFNKFLVAVKIRQGDGLELFYDFMESWGVSSYIILDLTLNQSFHETDEITF